jgi:hypothetical protein
MRAGAVTLALGLALLPAATVAQVPLGPLFRVNTYVTGVQISPRIAMNDPGYFVVTWTSVGQDGSEDGVFARAYDANGVPFTAAEFQVNEITTGSQSAPAVALADTGQVFFAWQTSDTYQEYYGPPRTTLDIHARSVGLDGVAQSTEVRINTSLEGDQTLPSMSVGGNNFIVVWNSQPEPYGPAYMSGRTSMSAAEFPLASFAWTRLPAVAADASGGFVAVWQDEATFPSPIRARRFNAAGTPVSPEVLVASGNFFTPTGPPTVASDPDGNFVVVWEDLYNSYDHVAHSVMARRYHASGAPQGDAFVVTLNPDYYYGPLVGRPSVAMDRRGDFVVAWHQNTDYGFDVLARTYDATGPTSPQFFVHGGPGYQGRPSVAVNFTGDFVVAWQYQDGPTSDIGARRFRRDLIFRDGFERGDLSAWSASGTDAGDLSVHADAALQSSTAGLRGVVDDVAGLYVQDDSPDDERRYRARFWFDPNGFDPGVGQAHLRTRMLIAFTEAPMRRVGAIVLRLKDGQYGVMGRARLDDNSQADTGFIPISDAPHAIELDLRAATDPDSQDGSIEVYVDGVLQRERTALDNSLSTVDFVRMGALSAKTGAQGTIYWDSFESRRLGYIGP